MRDDVKIGILGGFVLLVIMFIYWINQQPGKSNQPVNLTGKTAAPASDSSKPAPPPSSTPAPSPSGSSSGTPAPSPATPSDGGHVYSVATPPAPVSPPTPSPSDSPPLPSAPPLDAPAGGSTAGGSSAPAAVLADHSTPGTTAAFAALRSTPDGMHYYQTKPGDSAWLIATKFYNNGDAAHLKLLKDNNLSVDWGVLPQGLEIKIPTPPASMVAAVPAGHVDSATTRPGEYVIKDRDTLNKIAKDKLGNANLWQKIVDANPGLDPEHLKPGKTIKLPAKPEAAPATGPASTPPTPPALGPNEYRIKSGDTLITIAKTQLGKESLWKEIVKLNPQLDPNNLQVNKVIKLPPKPEAAPATPTTPPSGTTPSGTGGSTADGARERA